MTLNLAAALALALAQDAHAHAASPPPPLTAAVSAIAKRPVPLRPDIGTAHDDVSTSSREAQSFYDQGLAYLHSYVWLEAARSFNQALRLDPNLAMACAQLSIAYTELNDPAAARDALARARTLAPAASDHDRLHIEARALQMDAELATSRDPATLQAYRTALDQALARFPNDEELWLERGLAESSDPAERGQGSGASSISFYQKALALAPAHFAAHHYLTHAYENTGRIKDALTEGATYAKMAPGVPHARHMLGHDLRRVGQIDDAIREFEAADALEREYLKGEQVPVEDDWHYQHNLDLLGTSYEYVGRMRKAEEVLKASFAIESSSIEQEFNKREWPVFLLSRGRAREALDAAMALARHRSSIVSAAGHVMAGEARIAMGEYQAAADEGNTALRLMRAAPLGAGIVADALQQLQGEFLLRTGQREKGRSLVQEVVRNVRAAPGPDAWAQALFTLEAITRAARDVNDWELADWAARQMIDHDPSYGGSHYALALVAEHQGDAGQARAEFDEARRCWKTADADMEELQAIRSRQ